MHTYILGERRDDSIIAYMGIGLLKFPGDSVIFSFPPVDDLFGKMAVSRHVSLIPCSIQNYGEIEDPSYVFCLFTFFVYTRTFTAGSHSFYDVLVSGTLRLKGACCAAY